MTDRSALFVHSCFANPDRTPAEQKAIFEKAQAVMERLEKAPLRVSAFEPLVLRLYYLFCEAFMTPNKNRAEFLALCIEAFRAGRALRFNDGNPDKWATAALQDLLRRDLLREVSEDEQIYILSTDLGDAFMDNPQAKLPPFKHGGTLNTKAKRPDSAKPVDEVPRRYTAAEWFPIAVNLLHDGLKDSEIARRVNVARSTLSESPRWQHAKRVFAESKPQVTQFEKSGGRRNPLLRKSNR